ncbi:MAG: flagellar hook-basal body complex protein [Paracoccaceae bacterium]
MENSTYTTLTRQTGLVREMQVVANNIANAATTGYRQEGLVFSEYVQELNDDSSLSMATARVRNTSMLQGALTQTESTFDFGIEGPGFFLVDTPSGERLTRSGNFSPNADGDLVTNDGYRVLDGGGAPVFIPPGASDLSVAVDGTISTDGQAVGQIGLFVPTDPNSLNREDGVMFQTDSGIDPADNARIVQGFLEDSNVDPISQIARMIEVQRAYEMGQSFLQSEDERIRTALSAMTK